MCVHFFNFDHLRIKLQSSDFFRGTKFHALLFLSLHSSSSTFKLLSMTSYGGELLLDSSSTWSGVSIHLSPSPFRCNQISRSKEIHWWRRSKVYKFHLELHHSTTMFKRKRENIWEIERESLPQSLRPPSITTHLVQVIS